MLYVIAALTLLAAWIGDIEPADVEAQPSLRARDAATAAGRLVVGSIVVESAPAAPIQ